MPSDVVPWHKRQHPAPRFGLSILITCPRCGQVEVRAEYRLQPGYAKNDHWYIQHHSPCVNAWKPETFLLVRWPYRQKTKQHRAELESQRKLHELLARNYAEWERTGKASYAVFLVPTTYGLPPDVRWTGGVDEVPIPTVANKGGR